MNLPALQRIAMEFERENDIMDQRQEMMDDAIDDVTGLEDEEEGEEVVNQVLDEIGVDLNQAVSPGFEQDNRPTSLTRASSLVKHLLAFRRILSAKDAWRKLSELELVLEVGKTMICKLDWIACGGSSVPCASLNLCT